MKLIVWLGNPGNEYTKTRHNVGFLFLDSLQISWGFSNWHDSKFKGVISEWMQNSEKIILLKPTTFMNLSGESIASCMNFYKLTREDLILVFDDLDMEFGKVRFRSTGSAGGHNGIKSTIEHLGSANFARIKVGIGRDDRFSVSDWVLSKFSTAEMTTLCDSIFSEITERLEEWLEK